MFAVRDPAVVTPVTARSEIFDADTDNEEEEAGSTTTPNTSWGKAVAIKVEQFEATAKVKAENAKNTNSPKRETARYKALVAALTDPSAGGGTPQGRKVFWRGCHGQSITQILGGCGTDPCPTIINPPPTNFIEIGDFYIAGRVDWNPYTPSFPGDMGFVYTHFIRNPDQKEFHLFTSLSH
jgi:hypothetical protein